MSEFVTFLHEVFESFGPIRSRKMFGGHGIYHQDLMFGLVADDELYLKTDAENITEFEEQGLQPFEFKSKDGKVMQMSYLKAPEEIYDDSDQARYWADLSFAAAVRNSAKKNLKKKVKKKL
ncbi:MAG: DNA transformation protein [Pseudoalteromonas tetraodonis]|jgi:DNA transformation protein